MVCRVMSSAIRLLQKLGGPEQSQTQTQDTDTHTHTQGKPAITIGKTGVIGKVKVDTLNLKHALNQQPVTVGVQPFAITVTQA